MDPRDDPNNRYGPHITYFEEPDIIFMALHGDCTEENGLEALAKQVSFGQGRKMVFFLMDGTNMGGLSPGMRKAVAKALSQLPLFGMANYGAPLKARVVAKLVITAVNLFRKDASINPIEFFATEAEARSWINGRREKYRSTLG